MGKRNDGWKNTGASHWTGWGIANDRVIDPSIGRPWSFWGTGRGKATRKHLKNEANKIKHTRSERRSSWLWN